MSVHPCKPLAAMAAPTQMGDTSVAAHLDISGLDKGESRDLLGHNHDVGDWGKNNKNNVKMQLTQVHASYYD